ncbi:hypothetical protein I4F81_010572 [Pyropia yezoensis]|uniref:Uncharacterized protein n=1 Tax=Pyropia yezoensis TaxID=2788 RepID=A0ACC3CDK6_PYRYE|nr:hypothetical protein I4F81_010572 [Neopyropia yezoensis]
MATRLSLYGSPTWPSSILILLASDREYRPECLGLSTAFSTHFPRRLNAACRAWWVTATVFVLTGHINFAAAAIPIPAAAAVAAAAAPSRLQEINEGVRASRLDRRLQAEVGDALGGDAPCAAPGHLLVVLAAAYGGPTVATVAMALALPRLKAQLVAAGRGGGGEVGSRPVPAADAAAGAAALSYRWRQKQPSRPRGRSRRRRRPVPPPVPRARAVAVNALDMWVGLARGFPPPSPSPPPSHYSTCTLQ